jgi:hypothetical protein
MWKVERCQDIGQAHEPPNGLPRSGGRRVSQNRVDLVREMFGLWNAGDRDFSVLPEYVDPVIELESPFSSVVGEPYRGYAGIE